MKATPPIRESGNPGPPPVRSYCELQGIPVQQADEDSSGFWSLRETQSMMTGCGRGTVR